MAAEMNAGELMQRNVKRAQQLGSSAFNARVIPGVA